ncbi:MAG: hypothetical protein KGL04_00355 [Elusimicrobia bacterium]|nr:hypothetical protein [Elusimicrobiota bacterium]
MDLKPCFLMVVAVLLTSCFTRAQESSMVKPARYLIGAPPQFLIRISSSGTVPNPNYERESFWYGNLYVDGAASIANQPHLFSIDGIPDLALSTASIVSDLIPSKQCLWLVYTSYGWSDPHCGATHGVLLLIDGKTLVPIWRVFLGMDSGGAGEGYKSTADYKFSRSAGTTTKGYTPSISVTDEVWATTQEQVRQIGLKPLSTSRRIYTFNGKKFVHASGPVPDECDSP